MNSCIMYSSFCCWSVTAVSVAVVISHTRFIHSFAHTIFVASINYDAIQTDSMVVALTECVFECGNRAHGNGFCVLKCTSKRKNKVAKNGFFGKMFIVNDSPIDGRGEVLYGIHRVHDEINQFNCNFRNRPSFDDDLHKMKNV